MSYKTDLVMIFPKEIFSDDENSLLIKIQEIFDKNDRNFNLRPVEKEVLGGTTPRTAVYVLSMNYMEKDIIRGIEKLFPEFPDFSVMYIQHSDRSLYIHTKAHGIAKTQRIIPQDSR